MATLDDQFKPCSHGIRLQDIEQVLLSDPLTISEEVMVRECSAWGSFSKNPPSQSKQQQTSLDPL